MHIHFHLTIIQLELDKQHIHKNKILSLAAAP